MTTLRPALTASGLALLFAVGALAQNLPPVAATADEIPLERCDKLPVVIARVEKTDLRLLVDTAATTILNIKSFKSGASTKVTVSSYTGTASTSAREISLPELRLGTHRMSNLKLPAIDLSPIGEACGSRIDGILGVDLLERLGATIDLQRRVARLGPAPPPPPTDEATMRREHDAVFHATLDAFNRGDAKALAGSLDPDVVLFTPWGEYRGRQAMMDYVSKRYFTLSPLPQMEMRMKSLRIIGTAAWYDYDYSVSFAGTRVEGRGTGVCRKHGDRWLLLNMHNSRIDPNEP